MEESLRDSQTELSAIIENAPIVMLLVDRERRVRKANGAAIKFAGHPAEEMIGLRSGEALRCLHSLDDPRGCGFGQSCETCTVRNVVIDTLEAGKSHYAVEAKLPFDLTGKAEEKYLLLSTIPLTIREEQLVLVCIEDITDRKRGEETLVALLSRQEALLAAVPDIIMEVNQNKVYTWANQAGIEFFGEDVIGKEAAYYFEGEQDTYGLVQPLFEGNENIFYVESWQRRRDGQKRLLAWWCQVLKDDSGNVTGASLQPGYLTIKQQSRPCRQREV
jgi:PAS domain-containing protein